MLQKVALWGKQVLQDVAHYALLVSFVSEGDYNPVIGHTPYPRYGEVIRVISEKVRQSIAWDGKFRV